ncbi:MAG: hypothetical protein GC172_02595 [Phycisphaera sp.]|nr:hypothetical protein [Phycisphaera sp.]
MRILLDETETSLDARSIAEALSRAADEVARRGRMIVEVEVDGVRWSEEDLSSEDAIGRAAGELKLTSIHPAELLRETFVQAGTAVEEADAMQRESAEHLQAGKVGDAMANLATALALWGSVQTALSRGLELKVLTHADSGDPIDLDGAVAALDGQLRAVRDAVGAQDLAALGDCLLYEFPPVSARFASMLRSLAARAETIASTASRHGERNA